MVPRLPRRPSRESIVGRTAGEAAGPESAIAAALAALAICSGPALALGLAAASAVAAEAPSSAYSQSLSAEPDLLDHPALLFVHPQRATLERRGLFALDTSLGPGASGGIWTLGGARLSLLSPRNVIPQQTDEIVYPRYSSSSRVSSALRAGLALPAGALRVGLSAAGEVWKGSSSREQLVVESERRFAYEYGVSETNWRAWSALAGIGAGRGRRAIDLTWESRWEKRDDVYVRARQSDSAVDTVVVSFEGDERPIPGAHLRAQVPLGDRTDVILVGDWSGHEERRPGRLQGSIFGYDVDSSRVETGYRDVWRLGLASSRTVEPVDFVLVSAVYRAERGPIYDASSSGPRRTYVSSRSFAIGASASQPLRRDLRLQAGLRRTYRLSEVTTESGSVGADSGRHQIETQRSDRMTQEFQWGLDWTWRNLRVTSALSTTLALDRPFLTLDASVGL